MALFDTAATQLRQHLGAAPGRLPQQRQPLEATSPVEQLDGLGQLTALVRDGFAGLRLTHRSPRRAMIWAVWLMGIIGDGATTLAMIRSGEFVEANPAAAVGMGFLGLSGYVVLASVICMLFAVVSTGRARGPIARAAVAFMRLVATGKLFMAISNLLLWASLR